MNLILRRAEYRSDGILGVLTNGSDQTEMYLSLFTLEHSFGGKPVLPAGVYTCKLGTHKLSHGAQFETYEVTGVPKHWGILFHVGNVNADSDGCILLGKHRDPHSTAILQSRIAFAEFIRAQGGVDSFTLTVLDG